MQRATRVMQPAVIALVLAFMVACGPVATPEVIRDFSRANTLTAIARPSATPSGPTATPTVTSTPYTRPTERAALDLTLPILRVGNETFTLGDYRARVRYERFALLDDIRRTVEQIGKPRFNSGDEVADAIAAAYRRLADPGLFGFQVHDTMIRESIIRQEFRTRGLTLGATDARDYWIRRFGLQREPDLDEAVKAPLETYLTQAETYSGLSRAAITQIAEAAAMTITLRPLIARENAPQPQIVTYKVQRIVTAGQAAAERALADIESGALDFRAAACRYSIDPAVRGKGGDTGFVTRAQLPAGLNTPEAVMGAGPGTLVGPLNSPVGWHVFKINEKRRNADGDAQVRAQMIVVASETIGQQVRQKAEAGEDFAALACQFSLDASGGTGGELGYVEPDALAPEVAQAVEASDHNGIFGPIQTANGYEIVRVEDRKFEIPDPAEISQAEAQAFSRWLNTRAGSNFVISLSNLWQTETPTDPQPRDVAPYLDEAWLGLDQ